MSNITTDKPYKRSGGPVIEVEVSNTSNPYNIGSVMSFSSGKAIPAAADATAVGLVIDHYVNSAGLTFVKLDVGGAIALNCVYSSAGDPPTAVKWADNQTVAARGADVAKHGGCVVRVVSTNVADIMLPNLGAAAQGED